MRIDEGKTRGLKAEPSLAVVRPAAAWEENWREAIEGAAEEAEREAREAREMEREMGRKDTILAVLFSFFLFRRKEKKKRCDWSGRKRLSFTRLLYRRASWVGERWVGGEAENKGGEQWADPVDFSRAAELRLGRLLSACRAYSGVKRDVWLVVMRAE